MQPVESNIYVSLQRLIWSTFLAVLSFQIIAPNAWGYLNKTFCVPYEAGYWAFVYFYALIIPLFLIGWTLFQRRELIRCLYPFGEDGNLHPISKTYLNTFLINSIVQVVVALFLLPQDKIDTWVLATIQIINFIICVFLLVVGWVLSVKRLKQAQQQAKDRREKMQIFKKVFPTLLGTFVFFVASIAIGSLYSQKLASAEDSSKSPQGFALLAAHDEIKNLKKDFEALTDAYKVAAAKDSLKTELNPVLGNVHLNAFESKLSDTLKNKVWRGEMKKVSQEWSKSITGLIGDSLSEADSKKIESIITYLARRESQIHKSAQQHLGPRLRDSQYKLIIILLELFLTMISLYVFLRVDSIVKEIEWKTAADKKRKAIDEKAIEPELIEKEQQLEFSTKVLDGLWLYITISVWLLIPLFKTVEDEKIDTEAPFKMLTFDKPDAPWRNEPPIVINQTFKGIDTINLNVNPDFNNLKKDIDSIIAQKLKVIERELDSIRKKELNEIKKDTEKVKSHILPQNKTP